jgi:orotate phosphoribosyltransferase
MDLGQLFGLNQEQLIALDPKEVGFFINDEGIVYMAKTLDAYWQYDYEAAKTGKFGYHALLKSLRHSNGFFVSKILLQYPNILEIVATQLVYRYRYYKLPVPEWVAGIPDGAKKLGEKVAELMGVRFAKMEKVDGRIKIISHMPPGSTLLLVEDFCTRGTGFKEAVKEIKNQQPDVIILPYELVALNRGGLGGILVEDIGPFLIISAAYYPVDDWAPEACPLCEMGSIPIKPKETDENWNLITGSQK